MLFNVDRDLFEMRLKEYLIMDSSGSTSNRKSRTAAQRRWRQRQKDRARLDNENTRKRQRRAAQSAEERDARRTQDAVRHSKQRAAQSSEELRARRAQDAIRHSEQRAAQSSEELRARRAQDAIRHSELRVVQSLEERVAHRVQNTVRRSEQRASQSTSERVARRAQDACRQQRRRQRDAASTLGCATRSTTCVGRHSIGLMECRCNKCGAKMWRLEAKNPSSTSSDLRFTLCCGNGSIRLPPIARPPEFLWKLLTDQTSTAIAFRRNIRNYNNALSFTSQGARHDRFLASNARGSHAYAYRIQGAAYHLITRGLLPPEEASNGRSASFAEIYIYDEDQQADRRSSLFSEADRAIIVGLQRMLGPINPFIQAYENHVRTEHDLRQQPTQEFQLHLQARRPSTVNERRYAAPESHEIAALLPGDGSNSSGHRAVFLRKHAERASDGRPLLDRVSQLSGVYDPLRFVLLLPYGIEGWSAETNATIRVDDEGNDIVAEGHVTTCDFYRYRLQVRSGDFEALHRSGRLFQEYCVDMYAKVEENRLNYLRQNQQLFRVFDMQGMQDQLREDNVEGAGRNVLLPASFNGGRRSMQKRFQNAMAIVRCLGKPTLFITATTNPKWPEIQKALFEGQVAADRPDIVARVFKMKCDALMHDLTHKHVLGKVISHMYTIEWQKRGLPHVHILLILDPADVPKDPSEIDCIVSAEIPNPEDDPLLHETVVSTMLHGPCGAFNPRAACMEGDGSDRRCSKSFPKRFCDSTRMDRDGYPLYQRRHEGNKFSKNRFTFDNSWVVPYNPWLSKKYDCHMNVEVCTSIRAVKYLYKYVLKGSDRASVELRIRDEIQCYLDCRFVAASEACWRIFKFRAHKVFPSVQALAVHLPNMERVWVHETDESEAFRTNIEAAAMRRTATTLTEYFKWNKAAKSDSSIPDTLRNVLYPDFPRLFTWDIRRKQWKVRTRGHGTIGRVHFVSPIDRERYYLRMLLHHVAGAECFEDLRTINEHVCETFQEAAQLRGLLRTDDEHELAFLEAASHMMPRHLINFFVLLLLHNNISNPHQFLERHIDVMADAIRGDFPDAEDAVLHRSVHTMIHRRLLECGSSIHDFFDGIDPEELPFGSTVRNQIALYDTSETRETARRQTQLLNPAQRDAFEAIMDTVRRYLAGERPRARLFFVDGPGGSGKTFLYTTLLAEVRSVLRKHCIAVASSGIAALLLPGGTTAHSKFRIPLTCDNTTVCYIEHNSELATEIRQTQLIVFDEAPMMSKTVFEALDRTFRLLMRHDNPTLGTVPFAGIPVVLGGDFRQVLPVVRGGGPAQTIAAAINRSYLWDHIVTLRLHRNQRLQADIGEDWAEYLLKIGEGRCIDNVVLPQATVHCQTIDDMITGVFGSEIGPDTPTNSAILCPKLQQVSEVNSQVLDRMEGEPTTYYSADYVRDEGSVSVDLYTTEFLNSLNLSGMPPHALTLKKGCLIICLRNLDRSNGLCNGTRLRVTSLNCHTINATIVSEGAFCAHECSIPKIPMTPSDTRLPYIFTRFQFPVELAFAITVNKAQGQSLSRVGIYAPSPLFTHGQLYVMLSRTRCGPKGIFVLNRQINNVVYREVLNIS